MITQLSFAAANIVSTEASGIIGDAFSAPGVLNNLGQAAAHIVAGCAAGSIANGSCAGGAAGAVTAEFAAEFAYQNGYTLDQSVQIGKIAAVFGGMLSDDGARGITAANMTGTTAVENNFGLHALAAGAAAGGLIYLGDGDAGKGIIKIENTVGEGVDAAYNTTKENVPFITDTLDMIGYGWGLIGQETVNGGNWLFSNFTDSKTPVTDSLVALNSYWNGISPENQAMIRLPGYVFGAAELGGGVYSRYALESTSSLTPNNYVFWSGSSAAQAAAEKYALSTGGTTLEMTATGQNLIDITENMNNWTLERPLWASASTDFANSASGQVNVFHSSQGVSLESIWRGYEYPALTQNPNVIGINYHVVP